MFMGTHSLVPRLLVGAHQEPGYKARAHMISIVDSVC